MSVILIDNQLVNVNSEGEFTDILDVDFDVKNIFCKRVEVENDYYTKVVLFTNDDKVVFYDNFEHNSYRFIDLDYLVPQYCVISGEDDKSISIICDEAIVFSRDDKERTTYFEDLYKGSYLNGPADFKDDGSVYIRLSSDRKPDKWFWVDGNKVHDEIAKDRLEDKMSDIFQSASLGYDHVLRIYDNAILGKKKRIIKMLPRVVKCVDNEMNTFCLNDEGKLRRIEISGTGRATSAALRRVTHNVDNFHYSTEDVLITVSGGFMNIYNSRNRTKVIRSNIPVDYVILPTISTYDIKLSNRSKVMAPVR